jgi:hypothetical protein
MAHFAKINDENIVDQVIVIPDSEEPDGQAYINNVLGLGGKWIQTSYTGRIRKVFALPGYDYLPEVDSFKSPAPLSNPSFIFDEFSWSWIPPKPYPEDDKSYVWEEESLGWQEVPDFSELEAELQETTYEEEIL